MAGAVPCMRGRGYAQAHDDCEGESGPPPARTRHCRASAPVAGDGGGRTAHRNGPRRVRPRARRRTGARFSDIARRRSGHRQVDNVVAGWRCAQSRDFDVVRHRRGVVAPGGVARSPTGRGQRQPATAGRDLASRRSSSARSRRAFACWSSIRFRRCSPPNVESSPGSASQVRESAAALVRFAKATGRLRVASSVT